MTTDWQARLLRGEVMGCCGHRVTRWWHEVTEKFPGEDESEWRQLTDSPKSPLLSHLLCLSFLSSSFFHPSTSLTSHHTQPHLNSSYLTLTVCLRVCACVCNSRTSAFLCCKLLLCTLFHVPFSEPVFGCLTLVYVLPVCTLSSESLHWHVETAKWEAHTCCCWQIRKSWGRKWMVLP